MYVNEGQKDLRQGEGPNLDPGRYKHVTFTAIYGG